jgi:hypothetical protein
LSIESLVPNGLAIERSHLDVSEFDSAGQHLLLEDRCRRQFVWVDLKDSRLGQLSRAATVRVVKIVRQSFLQISLQGSGVVQGIGIQEKGVGRLPPRGQGRR